MTSESPAATARCFLRRAPTRYLEIPGAREQLHYLRSFADSKTIVEKSATAKSAIVVGAAYRPGSRGVIAARGLEVLWSHPIASPGTGDGPEVGAFIRTLPKRRCDLPSGQTVQQLDGRKATLSGGANVELICCARSGRETSIALAEHAGGPSTGGQRDSTCNVRADVYAAGDIARWPDPLLGAHPG